MYRPDAEGMGLCLLVAQGLRVVSGFLVLLAFFIHRAWQLKNPDITEQINLIINHQPSSIIHFNGSLSTENDHFPALSNVISDTHQI